MFWEDQNGEDALQVLEEELEATSTTALWKDQDECGWMISSDGHSWVLMKTLKDWLKVDVSWEFAPRHVNLLISGWWQCWYIVVWYGATSAIQVDCRRQMHRRAGPMSKMTAAKDARNARDVGPTQSPVSWSALLCCLG